jgi:hypothetical protein
MKNEAVKVLTNATVENIIVHYLYLMANSMMTSVCQKLVKSSGTFTSNALNRKFETNIPRMKRRGLVPNFHIHVSVSDPEQGRAVSFLEVFVSNFRYGVY